MILGSCMSFDEFYILSTKKLNQDLQFCPQENVHHTKLYKDLQFFS